MTDYISRDGLLWSIYEQSEYEKGYAEGKRDAVPVVHARWIMTEYRTEETRWLGWHCSNCGDTYDGLGKLDERKHKYCHHCGAIMDGGTQG